MKNTKTRNELGKKRSLNICRNLLFLGIISFTLSSCSTHRGIRLRNKNIAAWEAYQWKQIKKSSEKEVQEWTISTRKVRGTNFLEYKIEGDVTSSPEAFVSSFRQDIYNQAEDLANKKFPTYEILEETKESLLTYVIHKEPFPFKNTEMRIRYNFFSNEDGSTGVRWKETWDGWPKKSSKKLSRVQSFRGSWSLFPTSNNSSQAVNSVNFDPKKMPIWLVKPMVLKFLKQEWKKLRK